MHHNIFHHFFFDPGIWANQFCVKAGLNVSNVKNIGSAANKTRIGFNGGLLTEIKIGKKIIVQPEVLYSVKGNKFPATPFNGGGTLSLNATFLFRFGRLPPYQ
ncbi:MAG: outer membrane beta-barrel protein [Chitinophagaceae bacterium]|nr:outer membrane beta-barrel protein [Chitinophagaceae bacterium]